MCPHCMTAFGQCPHCRGADRPLRTPTERSIAAFDAANPRKGVQKSLLTNADRIALKIFTKPWRGVAATSPRPRTQENRQNRPHVRAAVKTFNTVLPAGFHL